MSNLCYWIKGLGITISGAIVLFGNSAIAQINQNATLTNKPDIITQENIKMFEDIPYSPSNQDRRFEQFSVVNKQEVRNLSTVIQLENPLTNFLPVIQFKKSLIISDWCPPIGFCTGP